MFKKKPTIKTLSPIRSSDRRKIADRIIADFQVQARSNHEAQSNGTGETLTGEAESKAADTSAHTELRNLVLPDNSLSARFSTTTGPDLKEVLGKVYVGSHAGSSEQRVLWVSIYDRLYPSVYMLWKLPGLLPLLHTPAIVVQKMKGGADLMTPGLAGPPFPQKAEKGAIVAIADLDKPSVPVAVGTCQIDISRLETTRGAKGCAVETFHWAGDELWNWSTSGKPGTEPPESLEGWPEDEISEVADKTGNASIEDDGGDEASGRVILDPKQQKYEATGAAVGGQPGSESLAETVDDADIPGLSTKEIDEAFRKAFLYGVYQQKKDHPDEPKHSLDFPLTQSFVMSGLVKPYLPSFTPKQAEQLDMKKTSWKNIRKFIKSLEKEKLLLSKDRQGNETTVMDIDFEDRAFKDFQPYRIPKREHQGPGTGSNGAAHPAAANGSAADPSLNQKLKRIDLYRPKDNLAPLFAPSNTPHRNVFTAADLNPITARYVESENLISDKNKRAINLNPFLGTLFDSSNSQADAATLRQGTINRDALTDRILKQYCTPHHAILRNDETLESSNVKSKPGAAPKVQILLETRSGNKTATRVWGLEAYFVREQPLADELRKSCASSTSVEPSRLGKGMEVMVQGPQTDAVVKALERRGVRWQWVEVNDKSKGKKKG